VPSKTPSLLSPEQRVQFGRVPPDLSDREIARYDTFSEADLAIIKQHRRPANRLGFATQLVLQQHLDWNTQDMVQIVTSERNILCSTTALFAKMR